MSGFEYPRTRISRIKTAAMLLQVACGIMLAQRVPRIEPHFEPRPESERRGEYGRAGPSESPVERQYQRQQVAPGVYVRESVSTHAFGESYSVELKKSSEIRFAALGRSPVATERVKLISLIDNSQTIEGIHNSPALSGRLVLEGIPSRGEIKGAIQAAKGSVLLLLTHISAEGRIQTRDGDVSVRDIVNDAQREGTPLLVVGCYSSDYVSSGYTTLLNSVEMVNRLSTALGSARSFRDLVAGLATPQESLVLDWEFVGRAHEILKVNIEDRDGNELGSVYISGFPGVGGPLPSPTGLAFLAVNTGLGFWFWRALAVSSGSVLAMWAVCAMVPTSLREQLRGLSAFGVWFVYLVFGLPIGMAVVFAPAAGGGGFGWAYMIVVGGALIYLWDYLAPLRSRIGRFVERNATTFTITGFTALVFAVSALMD